MFFNPRATDSIPPVLVPVKETFDAITLIKPVIRRNTKVDERIQGQQFLLVYVIAGEGH